MRGCEGARVRECEVVHGAGGQWRDGVAARRRGGAAVSEVPVGRGPGPGWTSMGLVHGTGHRAVSKCLKVHVHPPACAWQQRVCVPTEPQHQPQQAVIAGSLSRQREAGLVASCTRRRTRPDQTRRHHVCPPVGEKLRSNPNASRTREPNESTCSTSRHAMSCTSHKYKRASLPTRGGGLA